MAMAVLRDLAARVVVPEGSAPVTEMVVADQASQGRWQGQGTTQ